MTPMTRLGALLCTLTAASLATSLGGENTEPKPDANAASPPAQARDSVEAARDRASTMHDIYASTLSAMHHHYFHGDRAVVPARALEDVFEDLQRTSKVQARWISVNVRPMNIDNAPASDFEKQAAKEIAAGKPAVEIVEDGYYRRIGAIPLTGGCLRCHGGIRSDRSTAPKFAGLAISVPLMTSSDAE